MHGAQLLDAVLEASLEGVYQDGLNGGHFPLLDERLREALVPSPPVNLPVPTDSRAWLNPQPTHVAAPNVRTTITPIGPSGPAGSQFRARQSMRDSRLP